MTRDQYVKIRNRIKKQVQTREDQRYYCMSRNVEWIIKMYLHYAWKAVANGWPVKVRSSWRVTPVTITLVKEPVRKVKKEKGKRFFLSDKLFGEMFSVKMSGDQIDPEYNWYPDRNLAELIQESLDSDNIYELVKS